MGNHPVLDVQKSAIIQNFIDKLKRRWKTPARNANITRPSASNQYRIP